MDKVATRLMKDGIPFITRSISFYFAIPGTPLIVQILGSHNYYWTTPFAFCRQTGDDTTRLLPRYLFTYDFSKRNLKNQKLHKKKIRNKDYFFWPQKTKKNLLFSTDMPKMLPMSKPYHTLKHYPNSFHLTNLGL